MMWPSRKREEPSPGSENSQTPTSTPPLRERKGERPPLPELIPIVPVTRAPLVGYQRPSAVCSASNVPGRLFIGTLEPSRFTLTPDGWTVRYAGSAPDTYVDVCYARSSNQLSAAQVWRGVPGPCTCTGDDRWEALCKGYLFGLPADWEELLRKRLGDGLNVHYMPETSGTFRYVFFPDGIFYSVVCPVRLADLRTAVRVVRAIDADPCVMGCVMARLELTVSAVNYLEGSSSEVPSDPVAAWIQAWRRDGLMPVELPLWETRPSDGSRALTVRRLHYNLVLGCAFADLELVLEHLHRHGLVGVAASRLHDDSHVHTPEFRALLIPALTGLGRAQIQFFDEAGTRRLTYRAVADHEKELVACEMIDGAGASGGELTQALIAQAERSAAVLERQFTEHATASRRHQSSG
jgi:hypothetical protein